MLKELHIRNYAIIKEVDITFNNKLNIITGETGAGKSILMGALGLILGERADTKSLMNADDKCVIEGVFDVSTYSIKSYFDQNELDYDNTCILRREIAPNGKSRAFINDTPVNLNQLKDLGSQLVDIVSQHQTLDLNNSDFQLSIVDAIADNNPDLEQYKQSYKQYKQTEKLLAELIEREAKAKTDEDYLQFILNELNEVNPLPNEQEELEKQLEILSNAETIQQSAGVAFGALNADEQGVIEVLREIKANLNNGSKHHSGLQE
ncbi:MAG: AAA family ATPase, partial [Bacteroidia bacterium]